jgi:hypothetical protein
VEEDGGSRYLRNIGYCVRSHKIMILTFTTMHISNLIQTFDVAITIHEVQQVGVAAAAAASGHVFGGNHSNLGWDTGYPDRDSHGFSQYFPEKF